MNTADWTFWGEAHDAATAAGKRAREAYLANVPEPERTSFACPHCRAQPGEPCTDPQGDEREIHVGRGDRWAKAANRRLYESSDAADAVYTLYGGLVRGSDRAQIARTMRADCRGPYLLARGWTRDGKQWRSPESGELLSTEDAVLDAVSRERL